MLRYQMGALLFQMSDSCRGTGPYFPIFVFASLPINDDCFPEKKKKKEPTCDGILFMHPNKAYLGIK